MNDFSLVDVNLRDVVKLPNGHDGFVWHIYEYGYVANDMETHNMEYVFLKESPIPPEFEHECKTNLSSYDTCYWLDKLTDVEIIAVTDSVAGYSIFYKQETEKSKKNRLGKLISSIIP